MSGMICMAVALYALVIASLLVRLYRAWAEFQELRAGHKAKAMRIVASNSAKRA